MALGCQKELSHVGGPDPIPNIVTPDSITAHLKGNIFYENRQPAAGVTVKVGAQSAVTNSNGYFCMMNAALDKKIGFSNC